VGSDLDLLGLENRDLTLNCGGGTTQTQRILRSARAFPHSTLDNSRKPAASLENRLLTALAQTRGQISIFSALENRDLTPQTATPAALKHSEFCAALQHFPTAHSTTPEKTAAALEDRLLLNRLAWLGLYVFTCLTAFIT
jgi:hypothetical protein